MPEFTEWKLLPLDWESAREAVEYAIGSPEFDGDRFLRAVVEARLGRLSACIGQLIDVARYWHERGALPNRASDAMAFEIGRLLKETDEQRLQQMPAGRAMRLAKRLGAFTTFAGTQALTKAPVGNRATLSVNDLPSEAEPEEPGRVIEPSDYREVLDTALFDTGPSGSVVFRHQLYTEYLAAAYLVEREVQVGQVSGLLGVHDNGLLPNARGGVAAWLAALKPDLVEELILQNALMLASSAAVTELPSDETRALVVTGLLEAAATGDAPPRWDVDLSPLAHPGLSDQLTERLSDGPATPEQLWWIVRLALAGKCRDMAQALARTAADPTCHSSARRAAVEAVGALGDDDTCDSLRPLLTSDPDHDPDNEVRAAVIDVLYPRRLSTEELTQALRPHRSPLVGGYLMTLRDLPDRIPDEDLALFVTWLASRTRQAQNSGNEDNFDDLYIGTVRRAWDHADDESVRRTLAHLLVAGVDAHVWHRPQVLRDGFPWNTEVTDRRRALAIEVALAGTETWYAVLTLRLLREDDAEWLLDAIPTLPSSAIDTLANCLPPLLHEPSAHLADRILALPSTHPAYHATANLRGSVDLASEHAQLLRRRAAQDNEHTRRLAAHQEGVRSELLTALDRIDADPASWWRIPMLLSNDLLNTSEHVIGHDLTRRPGWAHLDTDQRQRVLTAGLHYLHTREPHPAAWSTAPSWTFEDVVPDWSGVHLLTTLLKHAPDLLTQLTADVWERWAPAIIATPMFTIDRAASLRCRLIDAVPMSSRPHLITAAINHLDDLEAGGKGLEPQEIYSHLLSDLAVTIADRLTARPTESELTRRLLDLLVSEGPTDLALETCRRLIDSPESSLVVHARRNLAKLDPNTTIDILARSPQRPEGLADAIQGLDPARLDHTHLVTATGLLLDAYPYADDPPLENGFVDTASQPARDLRGPLLEQLALGGHLKDLTDLRQGRSDIDQQILARFQRIAKGRQADLDLATTRPAALMSLLRRGDARLVQNDADLQQVLVRHLDSVQRQIRNTGAHRDIWNENGPKGEDDISDWLGRQLEARLISGLIIDREAQVARLRDGGIGTRIDLKAATNTPTRRTATVFVEAKRVDNAELMTAMDDQLINRYLIPKERQYGIYLVYWISPDQRPSTWRGSPADREELAWELEEQERRAGEGGMHIKAYILDISHPS